MNVRSLIVVLLLVLVSWGGIEVFNFVASLLGMGWVAGLVVKCAGIALVGAGVGFGAGVWASGESDASPLPFVAVGPFVALVHFANYITGAALVGLMVEVAVMVLGSFAIQTLLATTLAPSGTRQAE